MKYAVITGSTKGIGKTIVEELLRNDYFVFINYANDIESEINFQKNNKEFRDKYICIRKDLSTYDNAIEFCKEVIKYTNKIDVLILNCGITEKSPFGDISKDAWEKVMNINLNIPFYIIQYMSPYMTNDTGRIILMSSVMGKYPHSTSLAYNVSKTGLNALANSLVKYFSDRKITVNSICPGFINTTYHDNRSKESFDRINSRIALHRFGKTKEVASLCMEIIGNQYINGANIDINGGYNYF